MDIFLFVFGAVSAVSGAICAIYTIKNDHKD